MNNPPVYRIQFEMTFDAINCELNALVKSTEHPLKFHVLSVQSLNRWENASVINDFYITKIVKDSSPLWVHVGSGISSTIVQAIGNALDQHTTPVLS